MKRVDTIDAVRSARRSWTSVGFVPTMGALHDGHVSLMREAKRHCQKLVVSIFVNPTQFAPGEDLQSYPRDLESDAEKCESVGCDLLFFPPVEQMYTADASTTVTVSGLTDGLCGASRPTHFQGVTTIVSKLFNIVQPDVAVFGQKDYQQLAIIRKMVSDLNFPVEIIGAPTAREPDGLAMSSRNLRLTPEGRRDAPAISHGLFSASSLFDSGTRDVEELLSVVRGNIEKSELLKIDYLEAVDPTTLKPVTGSVDAVTIATAVFCGDVRLIDNITLSTPARRT